MTADNDETSVSASAMPEQTEHETPKKKTARRGRPPKKRVDAEATEERAPEQTPEPAEPKEDNSSEPASRDEEPEVRIEGVSVEELDNDDDEREDKAEKSQDKEGSRRNDSHHGKQDQGRDHNSRGGKQDRYNKKKDFQKNRNDRFNGKKNKGNHPNQQKGNHRQKGFKQPRKFLRDVIALADGGETESNGLELGQLPDWDVLREIEDLETLANEYAQTEEAISFNKYYVLPLPELREEAERLELTFSQSPSRSQLLRALIEMRGEAQRLIEVSGLVELLEDGNALLVYPEDNYRVKEFATFVPAALVRRYGLQRGHAVRVLAHPPREEETAPFALCILEVNGMSPEELTTVTPFTELVPYYPTERFMMEREDAPKQDAISMRVVDLLTPIGKGQRGLIVAPPRTGKTVLMQGIANSIAQNNPEVKLLILLVDERPEEVTDFRRHCAGEVIASTFDEPAESHVHAAEMVIEKARRMVEAGDDVVILLDSITRLARAYNTLMPSSGKILSGGVEANAMQKPKRFFGSARNIEDGGSLTILGTALVETGSRMDEVIFEEFKGTGNMELHLDRALIDKRIFPALSFERCGTRKEELLYHPDEMQKVYGLRRAMKGVPSTEAMEMLIQRVKKTKSNAEFLMTMSR